MRLFIKERLSLGGSFILNFVPPIFLIRLINMRSYPICKLMTCDCIMMTYIFVENRKIT